MKSRSLLSVGLISCSDSCCGPEPTSGFVMWTLHTSLQDQFRAMAHLRTRSIRGVSVSDNITLCIHTDMLPSFAFQPFRALRTLYRQTSSPPSNRNVCQATSPEGTVLRTHRPRCTIRSDLHRSSRFRMLSRQGRPDLHLQYSWPRFHWSLHRSLPRLRCKSFSQNNP